MPRSLIKTVLTKATASKARNSTSWMVNRRRNRTATAYQAARQTIRTSGMALTPEKVRSDSGVRKGMNRHRKISSANPAFLREAGSCCGSSERDSFINKLLYHINGHTSHILSLYYKENIPTMQPINREQKQNTPPKRGVKNQSFARASIAACLACGLLSPCFTWVMVQKLSRENRTA